LGNWLWRSKLSGSSACAVAVCAARRLCCSGFGWEMFRDRGGFASKDCLCAEDAKLRRVMDRICDGRVFEAMPAPEPSTRMHLRHVYVFSITPS
jgi:hypothetical protein